MSALMNTDKNVSTPAVAATQPVTHPVSQSQPRVLKLALDVHLLEHVVAMQYDGSSPKPPQRFKPKDFPAWVAKQIAQGWTVISCYEAGPFGYGLHRELTALGVTNHGIRPRNWDDRQDRPPRRAGPAHGFGSVCGGEQARAGVGARARRGAGTIAHREPSAWIRLCPSRSPRRYPRYKPASASRHVTSGAGELGASGQDSRPRSRCPSASWRQTALITATPSKKSTGSHRVKMVTPRY